MESANPKPVPMEKAPKASEPAPVETRKGSKRRIVLLVLLAAGLVAGGLYGWRTIRFYGTHAETDDAQVEAHIDPVIPKVAGYVRQVLVDDNQKVTLGDLLLTIDDRDYRSRIATAEGELQNARAAVAVAKSTVVAAQTTREKTAADLQRYAALRNKEEISQQQYDAAKAAADSAVAQVQADEAQIAAADAKVKQMEANRDFAVLQESYVSVTAPASGVVSRKNVELGQYVQAGQPLLAIVSEAAPWVVANFKETQLKKMRVGQPVDIEVDAYPKYVFHGKIDSIAAATGARFSLLPPDNATGNFTKVVQRIPVKIVLDGGTAESGDLRPGMSVQPSIDTKGNRG
jgi:membrane fusion protein, multidrug efflux system